MSAFVVADTHIDALVSAGLAFARPSEPMTWYHAGPDSLERAYQLRPDNPSEVGAMLLAANQNSVNYRYGERAGTEPAYCFRRLAGVPDPGAVLKAVACFEYQSCEHPDWPASQARQFCQELRDRCIDRLPGYDQAPAGPQRPAPLPPPLNHQQPALAVHSAPPGLPFIRAASSDP